MELEKTVEVDQMGSSLFFLINNPLSWIVVLAPLITFATFLIFGSLSILFTSTVLILSTLMFILFSKRKTKFVETSFKEEEEEIHKSVQKSSSQTEEEDIFESKQKHGSETVSTLQQQKQITSEGEGSYQIHDCLVRSPDVLSENECVDQLSTTEDSEAEWLFRDNTDQSPDYTDDGSISDEDSLIEIALPGGHYVCHHKEEEPNKFSMQQLQQKHLAADFTPESFFQQRSLMDLLAELNDMNEEENLIEIDISMGSIKCSRFGIEA